MKLVRIVTRLNIGGPSRHVALLSSGLDRSRFSTALLVGRTDPEEGSCLAWIKQGPTRLYTLPTLCRSLHPLHDLSSFFRILRILWQEQPQIVHTHMAKAGALGRFAGILYNRWGPGRHREKRAVLVHTFHGHVLDWYFSWAVSHLFIGIERWLAKRTDCLIAVSETIRKELLKKGIGKEAQWRVISLGVDLSDLVSLPFPNGSAPPSLLARPLRCGLVGRLVAIKNPWLFLWALEKVTRDQPKNRIRGQVIGDGPLRGQLEKTVRRFGLEGIVSFTGWQENRRHFYENLDVVCVTSRQEGTPLCLIEAMAAGRAVVSTAVGGVGELLGLNQKTEIPIGTFQIAQRGLLIRDSDAQGLALALETLAQDPLLRQRIAEAGRAYALEKHSSTRLLKAISELYEQLSQEAR